MRRAPFEFTGFALQSGEEEAGIGVDGVGSEYFEERLPCLSSPSPSIISRCPFDLFW